MVQNVVLEKADANMEEATIGSWYVAEGDTIEVDAPLVELITDKITFDYQSPVSGTVRRLAAMPGSVVPVGYVLAQVGDGPLPEIDAGNRALLEEYRRRQEVQIEPGTVQPSPRTAAGGAGARVRATPAARRLAKEHDLDLALLPAAAEGRVVQEQDVRDHLSGTG